MIELEYASMEEVPEGFAELYEEKDGKAVLTGVKGMKTQQDVDKSQAALKKERKEHGETKKALKSYQELGEDPEEIQKSLDRIPELEAASGDKLDEEQINKIVEGRIQQQTGPIQRDLDKAKAEVLELTAERDKLQNAISNRNLAEAVRSAAMEAKVHNSALPDIELLATAQFELNDDGQYIVKAGLDVTAGASIDEWLKEQEEKRGHWWPESAGGGAKGGIGSGGAVNPFTAKNWDLQAQGQLIREKGLPHAEKLAEAAGVSIGDTHHPDADK